MSPTMFWGSDVGILVVHFMNKGYTIAPLTPLIRPI